MKNFKFLLGLVPVFFFSACLETTEDLQFEAPVIEPLEGLASIEPRYFKIVSPDQNEIPLTFSVRDETGIQEIKIESHSGFDGHTHGRSAVANNFVLFNYFRLIGSEELENPNLFVTKENDGLRIFLDERHQGLSPNDRILAGPYHFSITATDTDGNETSYRENSTYHTVIYIQRPYAPQINMETLNLSGDEVKGKIFRNTDHELSSSIGFVWVFIEKIDPSRPNQEGEVVEEWIWGEANWPHQFRSNSGKELPNTEVIDIGNLLQTEGVSINLQDDERLVFWIEDANGNISVQYFNNENNN